MTRDTAILAGLLDRLAAEQRDLRRLARIPAEDLLGRHRPHESVKFLRHRHGGVHRCLPASRLTQQAASTVVLRRRFHGARRGRGDRRCPGCRTGGHGQVPQSPGAWVRAGRRPPGHGHSPLLASTTSTPSPERCRPYEPWGNVRRSHGGTATALVARRAVVVEPQRRRSRARNIASVPCRCGHS